MHPPLFQSHPLCKTEVDALVACHEEYPILKFFNACGDIKIALDLCFREEKKLRKKLNPKVSTNLPSALKMKGTLGPNIPSDSSKSSSTVSSTE